MQIEERISNFIDHDLITIQKPGRYVGGEFNQIIKVWEDVDIHVAIAFPDIYDIGFPNLGIAALYNEINSRPDSLAERVFAPWFDMEDLLIEKKIPLFTLESKRPIDKFDLLGFTIPYETLYTNVLNMLHLADIPIFRKDRKSTDPIVIAGGHSTFNPEPMHEFIDAFVIGEGEEIIHEIINSLISSKKNNYSREKTINRLGDIDGIYVPAHFCVTSSNGIISSVFNHYDKHKKSITKRIVRKLTSPIRNNLVPNINVVHDRVAIEIMRGCSRGCRFCQAGMIMRPVREVHKDSVLDGIIDSIQKTGISEISLLSLSSSDHSQIIDILEDVDKLSEKFQFGFSLPSLRIESFNKQVISSIKSKRKGNFTIAPEAGSDSLRASINKPIPEINILDTVRQICQKGWNNLKLYFMVGFPGETQEDVESIITLCREIKKIGNEICKGRFKLHISINALIPKAHTPFQWTSFISIDAFEETFSFLIERLKKLRIKVNYPDYKQASLEALLSRGDRYLSCLIFTAWKNGAKFDAWHEGFDQEIWEQAIEQSGVNLANYLYREKNPDEALPWGHIDVGVSKKFLIAEFDKSKSGIITPGCHDSCSACGIRRNLLIDCEKIRVGDRK